MSEELSEVWNGVQEKGWLTNQDTHSLENLFVTAGPNWFVYNLVKVSVQCFSTSVFEESMEVFWLR